MVEQQPSQMDLVIEPCGEDDRLALLAFHKQQYGEYAYQASLEYISWLYDDNPCSWQSSPEILKDAAAGTVRGCIHTMSLPALMDTAVIEIASLQNLIVEPELRGGAGQILVKRAVRKAGLAVFPGVAGDLVESYRALRYCEVASFWGRQILRPARLALALSLEHAGKHSPAWSISTKPIDRWRAKGYNISIEFQPEMMSWFEPTKLTANYNTRVVWTDELVTWRFFSDRGPKHIAFSDSRNFAICSVGVRRNARVARIISFNESMSREFYNDLVRFIKELGADMILSLVGSTKSHRLLLSFGIRDLVAGPVSFVKSARGVKAEYQLSAADTDFGLEALQSRWIV
jgi:hypothetical protein